MSLQLNSLFRKYAGTLADIDYQENNAKRNHGVFERDMRIQRLQDKKSLSNKLSGQGIANSGIGLSENVKLNKAYTNAGADANAQHQAQLSQLARKRLEAKAVHDESVALHNMTQLLNQG